MREADDLEIQRHTPSAPDVAVVNRVDLEHVARRLRRRFKRRLPHGYRGGKRRMEDALRRSLRIGSSRAAFLIDRLESEGRLVYRRGRRGGSKRWRLRRAAP